jgi:hypothetical protein
LTTLLASNRISAIVLLIVVEYLLNLVNELLHIVVLIAVEPLLDHVEVDRVFYYIVKVHHVGLVKVSRLCEVLGMFYPQDLREESFGYKVPRLVGDVN